MNWKVYVHINKINGKAYVGITSRALEERWGNDGKKYKPDDKENKNRHFWNAIKLYGWDTFSHELIEENLTYEQAKEYEKIYIELFDSYNNGYNSTLGGDGIFGYKHTEKAKKQMSAKRKGISHSKEWCEKIRDAQISQRKVICLETNKIYDSPLECAKELNLKDYKILAVCRNAQLSTGNLHFCYYDEFINNKTTIDSIENKRRKSSLIRKVICLETGVIYESIKECALKIGSNHQNVSRACRKYDKIGNYHYKFENDNTTLEDIQKYKGLYHTKKVICLETQMIFDSIHDCAKYIGTSPGLVSAVCTGRQKTTRGLHLQYYENFDNKIKCIETNEIFDTIRECSKKMNISEYSISCVCNKIKEEVKGFHFEYISYKNDKVLKGTPTKNKKVICIETGIEYNSIAECAHKMNLNPSNLGTVLNGRGRKSCGGFHFKYKE